MSLVRIGLDVRGDGGLFAETVTEDVFARIRFRVVAVRHDMNAGGADREDRNLEALGERMHRNRRVGEGRTEEAEQLTLLDEGLRHLGGLCLVRVVVLNVESELGPVHAARAVDLVHRQLHAFLRARPVDAAGTGQ